MANPSIQVLRMIVPPVRHQRAGNTSEVSTPPPKDASPPSDVAGAYNWERDPRDPSVSHLLAAISGLANACEPVPDLVTGGQPTGEHFSALKAAGCEVVLDARDPMETRPFPDEA